MKKSPRTHAKQLSLALPATHGGARRGAGRKPALGRRNTPHRALSTHKAAHPVHVTLRSKVRPLRHQLVFRTIRGAIARSNERDAMRFRVLHFSVQHDHVHLLVEAHDKRALSSGVRSLAIGIALATNRLLMRRGRFWADRWFGRALTSPRQVRRAIVYVLANFRKHSRAQARRGAKPSADRGCVDRFSSGAWFDGWKTRTSTPEGDAPVSRPRTWLASKGWRRGGLIGRSEAPALPTRAAP